MEQLCPMLQLRVCTGDKHPPAVHRHPVSSCNTQQGMNPEDVQRLVTHPVSHSAQSHCPLTLATLCSSRHCSSEMTLSSSTRWVPFSC